MESVMEFKEWLISKCRLARQQEEQEKDHSNIGGALTPQNIPEFVIPRSGESSRRESSASAEFSFQSLSPRNSICSNKASNVASMNDSNYCLEVPISACSRSAPVSPKHEVMKNITNEKTSKSLGSIGDTNADPLSFAAMSLPHFKAKTSFGFSTLSQSPHTRRKESLFHVNNNGLLSPNDSRKLKSLESLRIGKRSDMINSLHLSDLDGGFNINTPSVVVTPSSIRKNTPSPLKSSPQHRTSKNFLSASPNNLQNCKRNNRYYRRRSSLAGLNESPASSEESVISDASSTNSTPDDRHHSSVADTKLKSIEQERASVKRHSSPQINHIKSLLADEKPRSSSCTSLSQPSLKYLTEHGELKFAFQYLATSRQLKVTLLKAENLGGYGKTDSNMNAFVKLYLMPGKIQKQTSELHKHTRNPIFNQEFYFQGLTIEQLHAMNLRIKVFHRANNLRLHEFVGKVDLELDSFDILTENRMWKDLDGKREKEDLGLIGVSLTFEPKDGSITVASLQAKCLPHHQITGPPDPYIRIEVSQPGRSVSRKQTKTKKSISDPVYSEMYTFSISPKVDDMHYTYISLTVFDHERIRSDEVIGQIRIGYGATQESEIDQWNKVMQNPGQAITKWHSLLENEEEFK